MQGFASGLFGSLGAGAWGVSMKALNLSQFSGSAWGQITFGAISGGLGSELTSGNFWQGALIGGVVAGLNHVAHHISNGMGLDDDQQQGKEVTLKSLGIGSKDSAETIISKILSGMKPGDYASGDMFSFINSEVGDYVETVTRVDATNFKITTKGMFTGAALKNNSTLTITSTKIEALKITGVYKITLNGLTSLGKGQIYQNIWVNDNMRYMYDNNKWFQVKIK